MQRQLFLHHYFPALDYSLLLFASVFDLATSALKPKFRVQIAAIVLVCALWAYLHWSPLIYAGKWTKQDCEDSKWLKNWDFSCGDFHGSVGALSTLASILANSWYQYSDYDNVPHPTASKINVELGTGKGPAVEAQTPSDAQTTVEPAKNAFLPDKDDPPPAPKSSAGDAQMFRQAEAAHESAEKKEEAEHTEQQVKETEPTNVPGAELPAALVADQVEKKVEEEINKEAPVPLEEAAPTPSSEDASSEAVPIASKADTQDKAGAQIVRNAEADLNERGQNLRPKIVAQEDAPEAQKDSDEAVAAPQKVLAKEDVGDADADAEMEPVPAKEQAVAQKPRPPADADELAAFEERERHARKKEQS